jgi:hypothetical protein
LLDLGFLVSTEGLGRCVSTASISTNKHPNQLYHSSHFSFFFLPLYRFSSQP